MECSERGDYVQPTKTEEETSQDLVNNIAVPKETQNEPAAQFLENSIQDEEIKDGTERVNLLDESGEDLYDDEQTPSAEIEIRPNGNGENNNK